MRSHTPQRRERGGRRRSGRRASRRPLWILAALLLPAIAAIGLLAWSRSPAGRAALLRHGFGRFHDDVQVEVDRALARVLPDWRPGPVRPAGGSEGADVPAAGTGGDAAAGGVAAGTVLPAPAPRADAHDWPLPEAGPGATVHCRVVAAPAGLTLWEAQERILAALDGTGAGVLWGERLGAAGRGDGEALRLDLGVPGHPTHTLVVHEAGAGRPRVRWGTPAPAAPEEPDPGPALAIVIDDWGQGETEATHRLLALDCPLTLSVLPGLPMSRHFALQATELDLPAGAWAGAGVAAGVAAGGPAVAPGRLVAARRSGLRRRRLALGLPVEVSLERSRRRPFRRRREVLLHLPMEPEGYPGVDPGRGAILVGMDRREIADRLERALASLPTVTGVSNHMGSRATADAPTMRALMAELAGRDLLFLDSLTTPRSVARAEAERAGVPALANRVFLDRDPDPERIRARLRELARVARSGGVAVGIGHPYPQTAAVLAAELPRLAADGIRLLTVSELLARRGAASAAPGVP